VRVADLHDLTALEQATAIRQGDVTSVQLTEHYLARTEEISPRIGAFIAVTPDAALAQARAADEIVRRSSDPDSLPVLHGVVCPIKDLNSVVDLPTTFGSRIFGTAMPFDDDVVASLRAEGLVFTGKTNTPEFGHSCYTENLIAPPARTPWNLDLMAGGSSGGAAAAVAGGLAPLAQGSDGGGSLRIPASACGLVAVKPTRGRVSNGPLPDGLGELGVQGPLARTVRDAAALLDAMTGSPIRSGAGSNSSRQPDSLLTAVSREPGVLRVGRYRSPVIADTEVHPDCIEAYESASALLEELGHDVEDIEPPFGLDVVAQFEIVWAVSIRSVPIPDSRGDEVMPLTRWLRERGESVSGIELARAVMAMRSAARSALITTGAYDVILTPTLAKPPMPVGAIRDDRDPGRDFETQKAFTPFTAPYNVTGQPAMSIPLHWNADGVPIGVQLVGRLWEEATLLSLAGQIEQVKPWLGRVPKLWREEAR
jgi:amidase